MEAVIYSK